MRKGRKPSLKAGSNRLTELFNRDRFDEKQFEILANEEDKYLKIRHKKKDVFILKLDILRNQYALYYRLNPNERLSESVKVNTNLDRLESKMKETRESWDMI